MTKKIIIVLFIIVISIHTALAGSDPLPRVAVQSPLVPSGDIQLEAAADVISDTIIQRLESTGGYELVERQNITSNKILKICIDDNIDTFLSGETRFSDDGSIQIRLFAWNREERRVMKEVECMALSVFDLFDKTDAMVDELLSVFSSVHLAYGTLVLKNNGIKADYKVLVDDTPVIIQDREIPYVLIGSRTVKVVQNRMFGPEIIREAVFSIEEKEKTVVDFWLPGMTVAETKLMEELSAYYTDYRDDKAMEAQVDEHLESAMNYLENPSWSPEAVKWKEHFTALEAEWTAYKEARHNRKNLYCIPKILLPNAQVEDPVWTSPYNPALSALLDAGIVYSGIQLGWNTNHRALKTIEGKEIDTHFAKSWLGGGILLPLTKLLGINLSYMTGQEAFVIEPEDDDNPENLIITASTDEGDISTTKIEWDDSYYKATFGLSHKLWKNVSFGCDFSYIYPTNFDEDNHYYIDLNDNEINIKPQDGFSLSAGIAGLFLSNSLYIDYNFTYQAFRWYYYDEESIAFKYMEQPLMNHTNQHLSFFNERVILKNSFELDFYDYEVSNLYLRDTILLELLPLSFISLRGGFTASYFNLNGYDSFGTGYEVGNTFYFSNLHLDFNVYLGNDPLKYIASENYEQFKAKIILSYNNLWPRRY